MRPTREAPSPAAGDAGFTLVEMLVATGIFLLFIVMAMSTALSVGRATTATRELTSMNEQARIATERLTRELRQAAEIRSVTLPTGAGADLTMSFAVDFNGNNVIDTSAADPEILTYRYEAAAERLTLTANDETGTAVTRPILSSDVSRFKVSFRSSLWQHDTDKDGVTDWSELDAKAGIGNGNAVLDAPELKLIDLVVIELTVLEGARQQTYKTQTSLRNRAQS